MQPVEIVTQLRAAHAKGEKFAGINVKMPGCVSSSELFRALKQKAMHLRERKSCISNMFKENVVQPLLVSTSALNMATETVPKPNY